ncbi:adenosylcobinamide-phosphate synthase CbiB [Oceanomicrobium pacificus]|uniref:Cobalamin biosynthesis protein CobD n=1 Tax=Oceanomicrobium pacificus TaxID=2692916 RepID=A0A6B0TJK4_9RHOB|nr:adenosylcobinamide-phosphate synthase CbiB [Oceanomicrobium pacificus]MXU64046.1 cobalamin biosynthesis protein [Oceanomicrobium pacificus]
MTHVEMLLIALLLDAALGEPARIWTRVPHPAVLMGQAVDWCDRTLNRGRFQRAAGVLTCIGLVVAAGLVGLVIAVIPDFGILEMLLAAILLAQKSLVDHVRDVAAALEQSLDAGRRAVARIVGRDPNMLDESGVARAAIESGAENFSDGVVAPAFWFLLFGAPGILIYKAVNTADSMIGHMSERHHAFGWASAKLDDLLNWIPARIAGGTIAAASRGREAWAVMREDADSHRSPNAGWPEAAMAGALDIRLAGPRTYADGLHDDPWINFGGERDIGALEVRASVTVLWRAWAILLAIAALLSFLVWLA